MLGTLALLWCSMGAALAQESAPLGDDLATDEDPVERDPVESAPPPLYLTPPPTWRRYLWPNVEALGMNVGLWAFARYGLQKDWAEISGDTMVRNLTSPWTWDENGFTVNAVGHPLQGAATHTAARLHGLTYLEALPVVTLGSLEWEIFFETEYPSVNDQLTTMWSGPATGEVLYRLSLSMLDPGATGTERVFREIGSGLLNPVLGVERLATGKAWRGGPALPEVPITSETSFGLDRTDTGGLLTTDSVRWHGELRYGDPFARSRLHRPFDAFEVRLDLSVAQDPVEGTVLPGVLYFNTGALFGRRVDLFGSPDHFLGLFQHTTYAETPLYSLGTSAIGPGWWGRFSLADRVTLRTRWTAMATVMGALDSQYALLHTERDYVLGPGATSHLRLELLREGTGHLFIESRRWWVASINDPVGNELLGYQQVGAVLDLWRHWGIGTNLVLYDRAASYRDHEDFGQTFLVSQIHLTKGGPTCTACSSLPP